MLLLERLKKASDALKQQQVADQLLSVIEWHMVAKEKLAEQGVQLQGLGRATALLRDAGILRGPLPERPFAALYKEITRTEGVIREAGDGRPKMDLHPLVSRLAPCRQQAERSVRDAWLAYLDSTGAIAVSDDVITRLQKLGVEAVSDALRQATIVLRKAKSDLPRDSIDIGAVHAACSAVERAWSEASITRTMVQQVIAMSGPGLPLCEASHEVLGWLKDRKLDAAVRLRFS